MDIEGALQENAKLKQEIEKLKQEQESLIQENEAQAVLIFKQQKKLNELLKDK